MNIARDLRLLEKFLLLTGVIVTGFLAYPFFLTRSYRELLIGKIFWMQWMSRRFLRLLGCTVSLRGSVPLEGLIVSNHLGYVDIIVIGSICPAVFVAKSDVRKWPIFGWLASLSGTHFVSRNTPTKVMLQIHGISSLLACDYPIVLFPEGTSSDGSQVLPFRSSLLQAALATGKSITPAAISYAMHDGEKPGTKVAYWGNMSFFPHLMALIAIPSFTAQIHFGTAEIPSQDRKKEALLLYSKVKTLLET